MTGPPERPDPAYWAEVEAAWERRPHRPVPRRVGSLRGGVLAAVMLGMQEALEPVRRDEVVVEVEADGPVSAVDGVLLHFDAASPRRTVARVLPRPAPVVTPPP